ncbi:MAG: bifunctional phosphoribosylaminoimidazolecarboxamide formyltransferase/IMP cyclohydrolase, partial [Chloroflexota bacterium]
MNAILSVSDKSGLVQFARGLSQIGVEIYSTGGTKKELQEADVPVHSVGELTSFPEILDGRVKTLHPAVHGGILARRDLPAHMSELGQYGIGAVDLVAVNLYPFVQTISRESVTLQEALENIDIGGPTMIRAAAKNFPYVLVVVNPKDYSSLLQKLAAGEVGLDDRKRLAQKAFQHVAMYDTAIARYLRPEEEVFPEEMSIALRKAHELSYGENPHQQAAFYAEVAIGARGPSIASASQLSGKALSFNNILDLDAALNVVTDFSAPAVAVLKHTNPCGLACHDDLAEAYRRALSGDPVSAFGGIVASNRPIDQRTAEEIDKTHFDAIIAPSFDEAALTVLQRKRDLRLLAVGPLPAVKGAFGLTFRHVEGGFLAQSVDADPEGLELRPVTERHPTEEETRN